MADTMLHVSWGSTVRGREERGLEVFNEAIGLLGRMQQDGRIESFDVALMRPNADMNGFIAVHGSGAQIDALQADPEFLGNTVEASLIVDDLRHIVGYSGEGVARMMETYREAISRVPQAH